MAKALPSAEHGSWFEFWDANGVGFCQPDLLLVGRKAVLVLESKYSWVAEGHSQLELLYRPVVGEALRMQVCCMVVCKNLREGMPSDAVVVGTIKEGLQAARSGRSVVVHWLGSSGLLG